MPNMQERNEHMLRSACLAVEVGEEGEQSSVDHSSSFTQRTRLVLSQLQQLAAPSSSSRPSKRARLQHCGVHSSAAVSSASLMQGRSRIDASRCFFELLVLRNKGYVALAQAEPYGLVRVEPRPQLWAV